MNTNNFSTKATLLLVSSLTVMAGATIAPALPPMQDYFSEAEHVGFLIRLVLTLPALFIVLAGPLVGWFLDRHGRLSLLIPAMIVYALAGSSGLYLDSLGAILAGRALLGVAVAGIMTSATTLVADYYTGQARSQFMGWQAAFMSFGGVVFLTAGGGLAELGWRWPFAIYLFPLLLVPLVAFSLTEPGQSGELSPSGNEDESAAGNPGRLLPLIYGIAFFGMVIFYFIPLQIPFYLETLLGAGPTISGMAIAVSTLFGMVTSLTYGRIRARIGYLPILGLNFGLMGAGYLFIGMGSSYLTVLTGLAICGLGMGLMFPNLNVWLTSETPVVMRGRAVGGLTTAVFLGQFISPIAGQPVVTGFGLGTLFWGAGMLLLSLALLFILLRRSILTFTDSAKRISPENPPFENQKVTPRHSDTLNP